VPLQQSLSALQNWPDGLQHTPFRHSAPVVHCVADVHVFPRATPAQCRPAAVMQNCEQHSDSAMTVHDWPVVTQVLD
jgi:hypothetical protein